MGRGWLFVRHFQSVGQLFDDIFAFRDHFAALPRSFPLLAVVAVDPKLSVFPAPTVAVCLEGANFPFDLGEVVY